MFSIIIPVYCNAESLKPLLAALDGLIDQVNDTLEVVFVVDGSPDNSFQILQESLPRARFKSQLMLLSRNFGSFSAVAAGLSAARGDFFAVIAADLQEPPELALQFLQALKAGDCDLVLGKREARHDPWVTAFSSRLFWFLYRKLVQRQMPKGGVDVFGCNDLVRQQLLKLNESNSTLVGLLMWVGFRRRTISYTRAARPHGKSAWSFRRKLRYLKDSVFAFSDLPVRLLGFLGIAGLLVAFCLTCLVLISKLTGAITVPGYAASSIIIIFFGGLNSLGIAILGEYLWRTFENTKQRPRYIVYYSGGFDPAATRGDSQTPPPASTAKSAR
jgi:glycosyltransferase involved in cell wall biosynthesis